MSQGNLKKILKIFFFYTAKKKNDKYNPGIGNISDSNTGSDSAC